MTGGEHHWRIALYLAIFTVGFNVLEGLVSVYFGFSDETITLLGFGIDSFIEVLSGLGILSMVVRISRNAGALRSKLEKTALRVTGISFYLLAAGLLISAIYNLATRHEPETTWPGIVISLISIAIMWALVRSKRKVGRVLASAPILADANCTQVCIYMSSVLLISSLIFELTGFGFFDSLGALGLTYFSIQEGRECFQKISGSDCSCCRQPRTL